MILCGCGASNSDSAKIKMTTEISYISFIVGGIGTVAVDWGDGSKKEEMTIGKSFIIYEHHYKKASKHTITISGDEIAALQCSDLISLDVSNCSELKNLKCDGNKLTSLDVSNCTALTNLDCSNNQLTSLDASNCSAILALNCSNNKLTSLGVNNCSVMRNLNCSNNQLTSLNVSSCIALTDLDCRENKLTSLDVSNCIALTDVDCSHNQFAATSLDALFGTLHKNAIVMKRKYLNISSNIGEKDCNRSIAHGNGWYVSNSR